MTVSWTGAGQSATLGLSALLKLTTADASAQERATKDFVIYQPTISHFRTIRMCAYPKRSMIQFLEMKPK
jgi:hypothetical protein